MRQRYIPDHFFHDTNRTVVSVRLSSTWVGLPVQFAAVVLSMLVATSAPAQPGSPSSAGSSITRADAEEAQSPNSLDLDQATAIRLAEQHAPELLGPQAELSSVSGFRSAADRTLHRPPRIEVSIGPRHVPGAGRVGVDATVGVFQEFSTGHYGTELDRFATAAKSRAEADRDAVRRDARVRASLAWLDSLEARELLGIRRRAVQGAKEILRIAVARVTTGRSSPAESALARSLVGTADAAVLAALGERTVAHSTLRHVCGLELHRPLRIIGELDSSQVAIDENSLRAHVRTVAPGLVAARAQAMSAEQAVRLGKAHSRPHIEIGPTVSREGTGEWVVLGHVRVPLPGIDPAAADNAERQRTANLARAAAQVTEQGVLRDVEIALHEREHAILVRDLLRTGSIEPAEQATREAELQYEAGRADLVSVIASRRELFDSLEKWTRAAIDVRRAEARLERYLASDIQRNAYSPIGARVPQ